MSKAKIKVIAQARGGHICSNSGEYHFETENNEAVNFDLTYQVADASLPEQAPFAETFVLMIESSWR